MDEDALERIEADLYEIAMALGQPEALDDRLFRRRPFTDAAEQPLPIRERVSEKIRALDRLMALHDRATFDKAMENIRQATAPEGQQPVSTAVIPERAVLFGEGEAIVWNLSELPDLTEARNLLRSLLDDVWTRG